MELNNSIIIHSLGAFLDKLSYKIFDLQKSNTLYDVAEYCMNIHQDKIFYSIKYFVSSYPI